MRWLTMGVACTVLQRYVCNICDPKKIEVWTSEGRPSLVRLEVILEELKDLRLDALEAEPLRDVCEAGRHMVSAIQTVLASAPPPSLVQHWLRKIERFPIHLEAVDSTGASQDLRTQLLAILGLDKRRTRKQNPRWQVIGAAPSKNPDIVQCFCSMYPPPDAAFTALCNNRKCACRRTLSTSPIREADARFFVRQASSAFTPRAS